ncbi:MAG TPA: hypothetical protein PLY77_04315 [Plasticicumulans sp.]|nr:hypothetical protein [Plasticicumulans sp.]
MPPALPRRYAYLALLLSSLQPATAMLLYDNGPESAAGGIRLDETVIAQDFRLAAAALIDTVTFAGTERFVPSDFAWRIYADNSGKPGALLLEGSGTAVRTFLGTTATATRYRYTLDIGALMLAAGDYWLGLSGSIGTTWSGAPDNGSSQTLLLDDDPFTDPFVGWKPALLVHPEQSFQILGTLQIDTPPTAALLGSAALALALAAARRRTARRS